MQASIIKHNHQGLDLPCKRALDSDIEKLQEMTIVMREALESSSVGVAVAANQVFDNSGGRVLSCFLLGKKFPVKEFQDMLIVNPDVAAIDSSWSLTGEVCLSHPDGHFVVRRKNCLLTYYEIVDGRLVKDEVGFSGFPAVVVQHETDHLLGIGIWSVGVPYVRN